MTYHGPGQLVGYPLLPLGRLSSQTSPQNVNKNNIPKADYIGYIRKLEQTIIMTAAEFGVTAKEVEGLTGVWVENNPSLFTSDWSSISARSLLTSSAFSFAKLAAIGVKVDAQGISHHGFALNVNPDMSYWEGIIGCGLPYSEISLAQLLSPIPEMEVVMESFVEVFGKIFDYELRNAK